MQRNPNLRYYSAAALVRDIIETLIFMVFVNLLVGGILEIVGQQTGFTWLLLMEPTWAIVNAMAPGGSLESLNYASPVALIALIIGVHGIWSLMTVFLVSRLCRENARELFVRIQQSMAKAWDRDYYYRWVWTTRLMAVLKVLGAILLILAALAAIIGLVLLFKALHIGLQDMLTLLAFVAILALILLLLTPMRRAPDIREETTVRQERHEEAPIQQLPSPDHPIDGEYKEL